MDKNKIQNSIVKTLKNYGYDIKKVKEFDINEQEDGTYKCFLHTIVHHKKDIENGYPSENEVKSFWFNLVPYFIGAKGSFKIKNLTTC